MWNYILAMCLIAITTSLGQISPDGFMYGSAPSIPNDILKTCQRQAVAKTLNITYAGSHGRYLDNWCSTYESVIPCVERGLPAVMGPNEWFLKLIFNASKAMDASRSICTRFAEMPDLSCMDLDLVRVPKCMQWSTKSAIDHYLEQFTVGQYPTTEQQRIASIYACIVTFTTAGCIKKETWSCTIPQRRMLNDYYSLLGGNCRSIAGMSEQTTLDATSIVEVTSSTNDVTTNMDESSSPTSQSDVTARQTAPSTTKITSKQQSNKSWRSSANTPHNSASSITNDSVFVSALLLLVSILYVVL